MLENIQVILSVFASVFAIITTGFLLSILIINYFILFVNKLHKKRIFFAFINIRIYSIRKSYHLLSTVRIHLTF